MNESVWAPCTYLTSHLSFFQSDNVSVRPFTFRPGIHVLQVMCKIDCVQLVVDKFPNSTADHCAYKRVKNGRENNMLNKFMATKITIVNAAERCQRWLARHAPASSSYTKWLFPVLFLARMPINWMTNNNNNNNCRSHSYYNSCCIILVHTFRIYVTGT